MSKAWRIAAWVTLLFWMGNFWGCKIPEPGPDLVDSPDLVEDIYRINAIE